jgi:hypothetical protein
MRTIIIITAFFALSLSAFGQVLAIPTFTFGSNDVVQSSIMVFHPTDTNETGVTVKFTYTDTGAKRLEEFYRAHTVGEDVRWQSGSFVHPFKLEHRKSFGREGFWRLSETDAKALLAGLRGKP